jgi:TatD DNase family protein
MTVRAMPYRRGQSANWGRASTAATHVIGLRHSIVILHLYDAHNHMHDERLAPGREAIMQAVHQEGVVRMVVNGTCEGDWPAVLSLARRYPQVIPSFGCHPWFVKERSAHWDKSLLECLDQVPSAIGEIGLDRWIDDYDLPQQEEVFIWQLRLAAERNLAVSIHCLQAWGKLLEILQIEPVPRRGFLLHSYSGSLEMIPQLAELGGYFSIPGYFAAGPKQSQRDTFKRVPSDRLLIETDAPDQMLPEDRNRYPLVDAVSGKGINHPANLGSVYQFVSELLDEPLDALAARVEVNFERLFGS